MSDETYIALRCGSRTLEFDGERVGIPVNGSFTAPPPERGESRRWVACTVDLMGETADDLAAVYREVWEFIDLAREGVQSGDMTHSVELLVRLRGMTSTVALDVLDGRVILPDEAVSRLTLEHRWVEGAVLELECLPFARGAEVTGTVAGTITSGAASYADITDVRGDVPALTRFTFTDVSTSSKYLNRLTLGVFNSRRPIVAGDLDLIADATAVSPGASGSESGTIGGTRSRLAMSAAYQNVARFDRPDALTNGRYHAFMRVRDSSNLLTPPINLTAVPRSTVRRLQRTTGTTGTGTSAADTWSKATTAGSLLVMYVTSGFVTINTPSGWSIGKVSGGSGGSPNAAIFYKANASSESGAAAASALSASSTWDVVLEEWAGITTSSPLDVSASDRSSSSAATLALGPTSTPAQDHELVLAVFRGGATQPSGISGTSAIEVETFGALSMSGYGRMGTAAAQSATGSWSPNASRAGAMVTFKASDLASEPLAADLTSFRVIAKGSGGTYSAASEPVTLRVGAGQVAELDWDAGRGTVASYAVYMTDSTDGWVVALDSVIFSGTSATVGANNGSIGSSIPPGSGSAIPADVRVGLSLASGSTIWWQDGLKTQYANGAWELLYAGVLTLPPAPTPEGSTPLSWQVHVQARHFSATGNLDVDALLLLPAWGDMAQIEVPTLDLAALREWVIESHRDGSVSARLRTTDTQADAGQLRNVQQAPVRLRPGFNRVQWLGDIGAGVSDVTDNKVTLAYAYTPLYRFVTGQP